MRAPHWQHAHHSNELLFSTLAATPVVMSADTPVVPSREATGPGRAYDKTPRHHLMTGCRIRKWQLPTLPPGGAVPSAMASLTSLFGMGRGGSSPL